MSQLLVEASHLSSDRTYNHNYNTIRNYFLQFKRDNNSELAKRALRKLVAEGAFFEDILELARYEFESQCYMDCLNVISLGLERRGSVLKGLHELYRLQGACFIHLGQLEKAEDSLYKALEYPGQVDAVLVNLGTLDIQRKEWESATSSFREAIRLNSSNDKAWVGLSLCHRFKGDHDLAFGNLELALDITPRNETALGLLLAWYRDSKENVIYERLGRYLTDGGENENLWLAFVELALRKGEGFVAGMELERLRLTHPEFIPAYQLRVKP